MNIIKIVTCAVVIFAQTTIAQNNTNSKDSQKLLQEYRQFKNIRDDWANLARYQNKNSQLASPQKDENRVVFMGNSITDFWIKYSPEFFTNNPFIDRGISGQTSPQMLLRFRQDVVNLKPKAVVILCGTNDIAGNTGPSTLQMIVDNISSMSEIAQSNNIKVIIASVLPVYDYPWEKGVYPSQKIIKLNNKIRKYCKNENITYLDYFSAMVDKRDGLDSKYSEDGVHPNLVGYKVMEKLALEAIKKTLN